MAQFFIRRPVLAWVFALFIIIAGIIGSWVGATIMYWAARLAGRPFMMK